MNDLRKRAEESIEPEFISDKISRIESELEAAYREGYADAVCNYAVWNNGEQFVGVMRRPLKEVLAEVNEAPIPIRY